MNTKAAFMEHDLSPSNTRDKLRSIGRWSAWKAVQQANLVWHAVLMRLQVRNAIFPAYHFGYFTRKYPLKICLTTSQNAFETSFVISNPINVLITDYYYWEFIHSDLDDNKFTDAFLNGQADYLVTNDAHFNAVRDNGFPPINVISADEFLNILS